MPWKRQSPMLFRHLHRNYAPTLPRRGLWFSLIRICSGPSLSAFCRCLGVPFAQSPIPAARNAGQGDAGERGATRRRLTCPCAVLSRQRDSKKIAAGRPTGSRQAERYQRDCLWQACRSSATERTAFSRRRLFRSRATSRLQSTETGHGRFAQGCARSRGSRAFRHMLP